MTSNYVARTYQVDDEGASNEEIRSQGTHEPDDRQPSHVTEVRNVPVPDELDHHTGSYA